MKKKKIAISSPNIHFLKTKHYHLIYIDLKKKKGSVNIADAM